MKKKSQIFQNLKIVFKDKKYLLIFLIVSFIFYLINVFISGGNKPWEFYSTLSFFGTMGFGLNLLTSFWKTVEVYSFISLVLISLLVGILVSLIFYKINLGKSIDNKKLGIFGSAGIFLGAFVPGCSACSIGLISFLGIGASVLNFLPYKGLEISILSIGLLGFTIVNIGENMFICKNSRFKLRGKERDIGEE